MQTLGKESVLCVLQFNTAKYHEMIEHSESYCSYCCYTDHYSRMLSFMTVPSFTRFNSSRQVRLGETIQVRLSETILMLSLRTRLQV